MCWNPAMLHSRELQGCRKTGRSHQLLAWISQARVITHNTKCLAYPAMKSSWLGLITNSVTGVSPASPGPPALPVSCPRSLKLYNTERKKRREADLALQGLLLHGSTTSPLQTSRNLTGNSTSTSELLMKNKP